MKQTETKKLHKVTDGLWRVTGLSKSSELNVSFVNFLNSKDGYRVKGTRVYFMGSENVNEVFRTLKDVREYLNG